MREARVTTWSELHDKLFEASWDPALHRHRSRFTFRRDARLLTRVPDDAIWSWLAVAQHHGLPTRLVDWTFSPYVRARELLPRPLGAILVEEEANVFTAEMLGRAAPSLRDFDQLGSEFVVFLEPPSRDERIVNQYALFSLMPRGASLGAWGDRHAELGQRLVVPASLKWEVRDKLDEANVTERVLYPGLDGLSRWLERYYTPRT